MFRRSFLSCVADAITVSSAVELGEEGVKKSDDLLSFHAFSSEYDKVNSINTQRLSKRAMLAFDSDSRGVYMRKNDLHVIPW